ncbi:SDR family NAD(P)-dependent oxidoreductase [Salinactinospora qingdaonensis]|uniref:Peroxisomal trans-2-enoyl-CoA reductase n=1 Tax=Salinactinospora qingdaonensis TaxID=702744 RepID=A0ABP7FB21_9ACTN
MTGGQGEGERPDAADAPGGSGPPEAAERPGATAGPAESGQPDAAESTGDTTCHVVRPGALAGMTALVTGAGTGIGRAVALRLAALGALVVGVGRTAATLENTGELAAATAPAGRFLARPVNVRDRAQAAELVASVGREHGLQLLVNNAGGQFVAPARQLSRRGWNSVIDLNLTAIATLTTAALPWLAQRGGSVATISLSAPENGIPNLSHSAAARSATLGMTRELAGRWWPDGVRLNCIAPGTVLTEGVRHELPPDVLADVLARTPLGRDTRPAEVAELVAFLATPAGAQLTGQLLTLDGGATLTGATRALSGG